MGALSGRGEARNRAFRGRRREEECLAGWVEAVSGELEDCEDPGGVMREIMNRRWMGRLNRTW